MSVSNLIEWAERLEPTTLMVGSFDDFIQKKRMRRGWDETSENEVGIDDGDQMDMKL